MAAFSFGRLLKRGCLNTAISAVLFPTKMPSVPWEAAAAGREGAAAALEQHGGQQVGAVPEMAAAQRSAEGGSQCCSSCLLPVCSVSSDGREVLAVLLHSCLLAML